MTKFVQFCPAETGALWEGKAHVHIQHIPQRQESHSVPQTTVRDAQMLGVHLPPNREIRSVGSSSEVGPNSWGLWRNSVFFAGVDPRKRPELLWRREVLNRVELEFGLKIIQTVQVSIPQAGGRQRRRWWRWWNAIGQFCRGRASGWGWGRGQTTSTWSPGHSGRPASGCVTWVGGRQGAHGGGWHRGRFGRRRRQVGWAGGGKGDRQRGWRGWSQQRAAP